MTNFKMKNSDRYKGEMQIFNKLVSLVACNNEAYFVYHYARVKTYIFCLTP